MTSRKITETYENRNSSSHSSPEQMTRTIPLLNATEFDNLGKGTKFQVVHVLKGELRQTEVYKPQISYIGIEDYRESLKWTTLKIGGKALPPAGKYFIYKFENHAYHLRLWDHLDDYLTSWRQCGIQRLTRNGNSAPQSSDQAEDAEITFPNNVLPEDELAAEEFNLTLESTLCEITENANLDPGPQIPSNRDNEILQNGNISGVMESSVQAPIQPIPGEWKRAVPMVEAFITPLTNIMNNNEYIDTYQIDSSSNSLNEELDISQNPPMLRKQIVELKQFCDLITIQNEKLRQKVRLHEHQSKVVQNEPSKLTIPTDTSERPNSRRSKNREHRSRKTSDESSSSDNENTLYSRQRSSKQSPEKRRKSINRMYQNGDRILPQTSTGSASQQPRHSQQAHQIITEAISDASSPTPDQTLPHRLNNISQNITETAPVLNTQARILKSNYIHQAHPLPNPTRQNNQHPPQFNLNTSFQPNISQAYMAPIPQQANPLWQNMPSVNTQAFMLPPPPQIQALWHNMPGQNNLQYVLPPFFQAPTLWQNQTIPGTQAHIPIPTQQAHASWQNLPPQINLNNPFHSQQVNSGAQAQAPANTFPQAYACGSASTQSQFNISRLNFKFIKFTGDNNGPDIVTFLSRMESNMPADLEDHHKVNMVLAQIEDEGAPHFAMKGWKGTYSDLKVYLKMVFKDANPVITISDWASITRPRGNPFNKWILGLIQLIDYTMPRWFSIEPSERRIVMRALERNCPRSALRRYRTEDEFSDNIIKLLSFNEIIEQIKQHYLDYKDVDWEMFDRSPRKQNSNLSITLVNNAGPRNRNLWPNQTTDTQQIQTSNTTTDQNYSLSSESQPSGRRPTRTFTLPRDPDGWCENHQCYGHTTQMCQYPNRPIRQRRPNRGYLPNPSSDRTAEHRFISSDQGNRNPIPNFRENSYSSYPRGNSGRGRGGLANRGRGRGSSESNQAQYYTSGSGAYPHNYYQGARGSGSYGRGRQRPNVYTLDEANDPTLYLPIENQDTNDNLATYQQQGPPQDQNQNGQTQYDGQGNLENPAPHGLGIINAHSSDE